MSDLFHEQIPDEFIWRAFGIMAQARAHTFQILTKRPERMAEFCSDPGWYQKLVAGAAEAIPDGLVRFSDVSEWPLPNVWLGTSVEDNRVRERVDHLQRVPAVVRFLSCEPLIGPLKLDLEGIHWVIVGGESGRGHRPIEAQWVRDIHAQAEAVGAAFFFKQWGGAKSKSGGRELDGRTWDEMPAVFRDNAEQRQVASSVG
jgi:protein gp37